MSDVIGSNLIGGQPQKPDQTISGEPISNNLIAGYNAETFTPVVAEGVAIEFAQEVASVNSGVAIEFAQSVVRVESGIAVTVAQNVGRIKSGVAIEFAQEITLQNTATGAVISFSQNIVQNADGIAVEFGQRVRDSLDATHTERYGWDVFVYIAGQQIDKCQIYGAINVSKPENSAALADFILINRTGAQDFADYHGKRVLIDVETATGTRRIFTGTVDIPEIDLTNKRVRLRCTDRRNERINAELGNFVKTVGNYSSAIFEEPEDVAEELRQRLETTPRTLDFDAFGGFRFPSYNAKQFPDFTLDRCDILETRPSLSIASRARLINRVNLKFEAQWVRLRHREKRFTIETPTFCDYMTVVGLEWLRTDSVLRSLDNFNWAVNPNSISIEPLPPGGWYFCGVRNRRFLWSPISFTGRTVNQTDENGDVITDENGNPKTEIADRTGTNFTDFYSLGATWTAAKRWAQDISENINITLRAPQSINQYGEIVRSQSNGYRVDYDASEFENNGSYETAQGFTGIGDQFVDKTGNVQDYKDALNTAISIGETQIIKSHRDNKVRFTRRIDSQVWPDVECYHTIQINTDTITTRGKVSSVVHRIDASSKKASTQVEISFSRAQGAAPSDSLTIPILDAPLRGTDDSEVVQQLYARSGPRGPSGGGLKTPLERRGSISTPAIESEARQRQVTEDNYSLDIPIQNDPLTVNF